MAECGDKYAHLIKTHSGLTPEDPCGWVCSGFDYEDWHAAATDNVLRQVSLHWSHLTAREKEHKTTEYSDALRPTLEGYREAYDELPKYWWQPDWTRPLENYKPAILRVIRNMREGTCLLEEIDDALEALGAPIPGTPKVGTGKTTVWDWIGVGLVLGGVGLAVYWGASAVARHRAYTAALTEVDSS